MRHLLCNHELQNFEFFGLILISRCAMDERPPPPPPIPGQVGPPPPPPLPRPVRVHQAIQATRMTLSEAIGWVTEKTKLGQPDQTFSGKFLEVRAPNMRKASGPTADAEKELAKVTCELPGSKGMETLLISCQLIREAFMKSLRAHFSQKFAALCLSKNLPWRGAGLKCTYMILYSRTTTWKMWWGFTA